MPLLPLALTMGDPAGIGPDITLQIWSERRHNNCPPFILYGDRELLRQRAAALGLTVPTAIVNDPAEAPALFDTSLPLVPVPLSEGAIAGQSTAINAPAIIASIEQCVSAVANGQASAIVTNPIAKQTLYAAGFKYPGHTEFLGHLAAAHWPEQMSGTTPATTAKAVMMLACDELRVVPLTVHIPLQHVAGSITHELITQTSRIIFASLIADFGISEPRLAIAGLNPHAGEGGSMGHEENALIEPAIAELQAQGFDVTGPHPADTLFHQEARQRYDAVLAMYHDQALIPIKTLAFDRGVNVTIGLPFTRTSPDHGTAFDIAGSGQANPASLLAALQMAQDMAAKRRPASVVDNSASLSTPVPNLPHVSPAPIDDSSSR